MSIKWLVKNVLNNLIHNCQQLETTLYPSTRKWILWYIHIMEYYSAIKMNELITHTATWMNRRTSMLNWRKPDTKEYINNSIYEVLEQAKLIYDPRSLCLPQGVGRLTKEVRDFVEQWKCSVLFWMVAT